MRKSSKVIYVTKETRDKVKNLALSLRLPMGKLVEFMINYIIKNNIKLL